MSLLWPAFLRRHWCLYRARRALLGGRPECALEHLADPDLAHSRGAESLRRRALDLLAGQAARRADAGQDSSLRRLLGRLAQEEGRGAAGWPLAAGAPLGLRQTASSGAGSSGAGSVSAHGGLNRTLARLLQQMRGDPDPADPNPADPHPAGATAGEPHADSGARPPAEKGTPPGADPGSAGETGPENDPETVPATSGRRALRFHLAVDDGGEFLAVAGSEIVIGHSRSARADLPFLADLEARHACLFFCESFHGGPTWNIQSRDAGQVSVNGRHLKAEATTLFDGDRVALAPNLSFVFRLPQFSCSSALIELEHGIECEGTVRILLLAAGPAGTVRIGPSRRRLIPVPDLEHEVELTLDANWTRLALRCAGGIRVHGSAAEPALEVGLDLPPAGRVDLELRARPGQPAPFGLSLRAIQAPAGPMHGGRMPGSAAGGGR